ncbi:MAG: hypothetical protein QM791_21650 [Ferruginibacter sp.]
MKNVLAIVLVFLASCSKKETTVPSTPNLVIKFKFDSTQVRLNNIGQPSTLAAGHAGQSPVMNKMGAHYIELAPNALTALGSGVVLYRAAETTAGGESAIDFEKEKMAGNGEVFFQMPLKDIPKGSYEWIRISLAYQNGDMKYRVDTTISGVAINQEFTGTLAGFIGFNSYIKSFNIKNQAVAVNANKKQGFWGFETTISYGGVNYPFSSTRQAPAGATTVVNPIASTSPIPAGSCVVTAAFVPGKLTITGSETSDIVIEASFSTNKSFEWEDTYPNGKFDPLKGEKFVDMGIRGMIPRIQ